MAHAAACTPHGSVSTDPIITLLLAALPVGRGAAGSSGVAHSGTSTSWACLLQAALYEGVLGCTVLMLLHGRWWAWLVAWEGWLAWQGTLWLSNTTTSNDSHNRSSKLMHRLWGGSDSGISSKLINTAASARPNEGCWWVDTLPLPAATSASTGADAAVASSAGGTIDRRSSSMLQLLLHRAGLALLHLGLPVVLAAAGLWR